MVQVIPLTRKFSAQNGIQTQKRLGYLVQGLTDDNDAVNQVLATVPAFVLASNGYPLPLNQVDPVQLADDIYEVTVTWGEYQNRNDLKPVFTFDTGGETAKITQSIATSGMFAPTGKTAPDFNGAIGVTEHGIEGVDIPVACHKWTEKHYLDDSTVTPAWRIAVTLLSHRTNGSQFRGFDVDQVQFDHVSGSKTGNELWEVTFYFEAGPHIDGIAIGNINGISKKAWEYLWVLYEDKQDPASNYLVKNPIAVYVEQVLYQGDFSTLMIPQGAVI